MMAGKGICKCSDKTGRNLVICIDGAYAPLGQGNTHVFDLFSKCAKTEHTKQLTYYSDGINAGVRSMQSTWRLMTAVYGWNYDKVVMGAYRWLVDNYQEADKIFCIGYSRGAYHVRTLAAMIHKVGIINRYKGNEDQISQAFHYYAFGKEDIAARFKSTFSWDKARVHFVGVWETTMLDMALVDFPLLPASEDHVCFFRQALALDERRGRFQAICALNGVKASVDEARRSDCAVHNSETEDVMDHSSGHSNIDWIPHIKEVWFPGTHSQIGGPITKSEQSSGSLGRASYLWMSFEAVSCGIHLPPSRVDWDWDDLQNRPIQISLAWRILEVLPMRTRKIDSQGNRSSAYTLNFLRSRVVQPGQKVHSTVAFYNGDYCPRATLYDTNLQWDRLVGKGLQGQGWDKEWDGCIERDYLEHGLIPSVIETLKSGAGSRGIMWAYRLAAMTLTEQGMNTLKNTPHSADDLSQIFSQVDDPNIQDRLTEIIDRSSKIYGGSSPLLSPEHSGWLLRIVRTNVDVKFREFAFRLLASSLVENDSLENTVDGQVLGILDELTRDEEHNGLADGAYAMFKTIVGHETLSRRIYALNTLSILRKRFTSGDSHSQRVSKTFFQEVLQHNEHRQHLFDNDVLQYWLTKIEFLNDTERILFTLFLQSQYDYMSNELLAMLTAKLSNKTNDRQFVGQNGLYNVLSILRDIADNDALISRVWDEGITNMIQQASTHVNYRVRLLALKVFRRFISHSESARRDEIFDPDTVKGFWNALNDVKPDIRICAVDLLADGAVEDGLRKRFFDQQLIASFVRRSITQGMPTISAILALMIVIRQEDLRANILDESVVSALLQAALAEDGHHILRGCANLFFASVIPLGILGAATISALGVAGDDNASLEDRALNSLSLAISQKEFHDGTFNPETLAALRIPFLTSLGRNQNEIGTSQHYLTAVLSQASLRNKIFDADTVVGIQRSITTGHLHLFHSSDSLLARAVLTYRDIRVRIFDTRITSLIQSNVFAQSHPHHSSQFFIDFVKDIRDECPKEQTTSERHSTANAPFFTINPLNKGNIFTEKDITTLMVLLRDDSSEPEVKSGVIDLLTSALSGDANHDFIFSNEVIVAIGCALSDVRVPVKDSLSRFFIASLSQESMRSKIFDIVGIPALLKAGFKSNFWTQEYIYRRAFDYLAVSRLCRQLASDPRSRKRTLYFISEAVKHADIHDRICTEDLREHFVCPIHKLGSTSR